MLIEAAVSASVAWLWQKLADKATTKDNEIALKKALKESIDQAYRQFQSKYGESTTSFFNHEFLEEYVCPQILILLTRHNQPDIEAILKALPVNALFNSQSGFRDEINDFFTMVQECMKAQPILQDIIDHRQIEGTFSNTQEIKRSQEFTQKLIEQSFEESSYAQEKSARDTEEILSRVTNLQNTVSHFVTNNTSNLPNSTGNETNRFLSKQLDRARDMIDQCRFNDTFDLLNSLEEEITSADNHTRFRWHTNLGACHLANDDRKKAAEHFFVAYNFAKNDEKAIANRIRAHLLVNQFDEGINESISAIKTYPASGIIWALHINALHLANKYFDESLLPSELNNDYSVLLMLSELRFSEHQYEQAFELAKNAYDNNQESDECKRAMLATALSWATVDAVKAHYGQLTSAQLTALKIATNSFDDIINYLKKIQSRHLFTEIAHNYAIAIDILGSHQLLDEISALASSTYPEENAFIWNKLQKLYTSKDFEGIHELTDNKFEILNKPILMKLGEISANNGDIEWNEKILENLRNCDLDEHDKYELLGLELSAVWHSGDKSKALDLANTQLPTIMERPALLCFYIRMLDDCGLKDKRDTLLHTCTTLTDYTSSLDLIQVADLLYDFDYFYEAALLYEKFITSPSNNLITKRYLDSLIKSDQRAKASSVLEKLAEEDRLDSSILRLEANLARASGDLNTLYGILSGELQKHPTDSSIAVGYIATLYRQGELQELREYLATNPVYNPTIISEEIELAKYQMHLGFEHDALYRLYSLFRSNQSNQKIAGQFMLFVLLAGQIVENDVTNTIRPGSCVNLESDYQNKTIVIEPHSIHKDNGWPECTSEYSELANQLIGLSIGDKTDIHDGFSTKTYLITGISSIFIFAANLAHKLISNSVSMVGPVWSVRAIKPDGEFDPSAILEPVKNRGRFVEYIFGIYAECKTPLQILSDALGTDLVTLLLEWPYLKYDLYVCSGIREHTDYIRSLVNEHQKPCIIDLTCLIELNRLGLLQDSLAILGKPLASASLREQLLDLQQLHGKNESTGVVSEIDGTIIYRDIPQHELDDRKTFINELLSFVDNCCEVVPVIGPENITKQQASIGNLINPSSQDAIYLALERDGILVTEDGVYRNLAVSLGVRASTWVQPVLMILRDRNQISHSKYSKAILDKINRRHTFTSVSADDLLWSTKSYSNTISPEVKSAIETFKSPVLDLPSGVVVGSNFLRLAAEHVTPKTLHGYYIILLDALSYGREAHKEAIQNTLRSHVIQAIPFLDRKKSKGIHRVFGDELYIQNTTINKPVLKPTVIAIKLALQDYR